MPEVPELSVRLKADTSQLRAEFDAIEAQIQRIKSEASGLGAWIAAEVQQKFAQALEPASSPSSEAEVAPAAAPMSEAAVPQAEEAQPSLAEALASLGVPANAQNVPVEQSANEGIPPVQ